MKKIILLSLLGVFAFGSCTKNNEGITYTDYTKQKFQSDFISTFGTPASDQDWGFDDIKIFDYTENALTRSHDVNRNEWANKYVIPANVTSAEEQAVLKKLAEGSGNRDKNITINYSDFFVYHVHKGTDSYNDHNGNNIGTASDKMNHLQCGKPGSTVSSSGNLNGTWEHVNDFNSGQQNANWWTIEGATAMLGSGSANFAYHNTSDSKYHDTYTVIDGASIGYPGFYYICFDFLANGDIEQPANKNMGVDRNYNYTDWIIRVSPLQYNLSGGVRIIAEDLGQSDGSDFDYNDVVFDVKLANEWVGELNANKLVAYITLQAAGGTLPLTVAGQEVHNLFGVATDVMVNTGAGASRPPVSFKAILKDADLSISGSDAAKNLISVVVNNKGNVAELSVETGKAPEKIAVPITFVWCPERLPINKKYPLFSNWVLNKSVKWN